MSELKNTEKNKILYRRFIQEIFNEGNFDKLDELVSSEYKLQNAPLELPTGRDAIKHIVSMFRGAFPDLKITIEELIGENDILAARSVTQGTHKGTIFGIPPTNRTIAMPGLTMVRIIDNQLHESWVRNDLMGLLEQLGAGPKK